MDVPVVAVVIASLLFYSAGWVSGYFTHKNTGGQEVTPGHKKED